MTVKKVVMQSGKKEGFPFSDLKVVELASVLAGPAVGMFFAELGAKVVKIENARVGGDMTRRWKNPNEDPNSSSSAYYQSVNWGKEAIFLDLTKAEDYDTAIEFISTCDILITNHHRRAQEKLGIEHEKLQALNPQLIHVNLTGFGEESDRPGFDAVLQAETGFLFMNGHRGESPVKMPVALIDLLAAHQMKTGVLMALLNRTKTGKGSYITVNLAQSAIASLANQASNWLNAGFIPQPMGSRHPNIAPYGDIFRTSDQQSILLAVGNDRQFSALCEVLNLPSMPADDRFAINSARVENRSLLVNILQQAIGQFAKPELMEQLLSHKVPACGINRMDEVFALDYAEEMILEYPDQKSKAVRTIAFKFA